VGILQALRDELAGYAARAKGNPDALVFSAGTGKPLDRSRVRARVLLPAVENANEQLAENGVAAIPCGLGTRSLRRTFASILYALGEDPPYVMGQMGHTEPDLALKVYAQVMSRRDGEQERLRALVEGRDPSEYRLSSRREAVSEEPARP
jgi:integrase